MVIQELEIARYNNQAIVEYQLIANNGFRTDILNYGGIIRAIYTHDKNDKLENIIVSNLEFNPSNPGHAGAITGPVAGRISHGKFMLNNIKYQLELNNNPHNLHSGSRSLDKQVWQVSRLADGISLSYTTYDGEFGFPGIVNFIVNYQISSDNQLSLTYLATSNQDTIINLTNHSYFDLSCGHDPMGQELFIDADYFGAIDATGLFNGQLINVSGTPFDFRIPKPLRQDILYPHRQLSYGHGYDHPFILNPAPIKLLDPYSGRSLNIITSEPGCVLYTANFFEPRRVAVCLETQKMPNAINLPQYKNQVIIGNVDQYTSKTIWQFGVI